MTLVLTPTVLAYGAIANFPDRCCIMSKYTQWAPSIKNAEDSSSESRSAESSKFTRNNRTALNLSPSKPARSLQKKIWRRLRERLSRAARRLEEDSLEIHSPAVESIHSR